MRTQEVETMRAPSGSSSTSWPCPPTQGKNDRTASRRNRVRGAGLEPPEDGHRGRIPVFARAPCARAGAGVWPEWLVAKSGEHDQHQFNPEHENYGHTGATSVGYYYHTYYTGYSGTHDFVDGNAASAGRNKPDWFVRQRPKEQLGLAWPRWVGERRLRYRRLVGALRAHNRRRTGRPQIQLLGRVHQK